MFGCGLPLPKFMLKCGCNVVVWGSEDNSENISCEDGLHLTEWTASPESRLLFVSAL